MKGFPLRKTPMAESQYLLAGPHQSANSVTDGSQKPGLNLKRIGRMSYMGRGGI